VSQKVSRIIKSLKKIDDVINIDTEVNEVGDEKEKVIGSFDYDECHYSFFYSESSPLIISEISLSFTYEDVVADSEINIYKSIDEFNKYSFAIKASIIELNIETKEISIDFSSGSLLDPSFIGESLIDLHGSITILYRIPIKLSSIFKENGVIHDYLNDLDNDIEGE